MFLIARYVFSLGIVIEGIDLGLLSVVWISVLVPEVDGRLSGSSACSLLLLRLGNWKSASCCVAVSISSLSGLCNFDELSSFVSSITIFSCLQDCCLADYLVLRFCWLNRPCFSSPRLRRSFRITSDLSQEFNPFAIWRIISTEISISILGLN